MDKEKFFDFATRYSRYCYSQLGQDLWVLSTLATNTGYFVEVGASDGVNISNTLLLELLGWDGLLIEPNPSAFRQLRKNRSAKLSDRCVWNSDGETVMFQHVRTNPELSRMLDKTKYDSHDVKGSRSHFETIEVKTARLRTLLAEHNAPDIIDYVSIDTEGSEPDIVEDFPFDQHAVRMFSIEHNYTDNLYRLKSQLEARGYVQVLPDASLFDAWFVHPELVPANAVNWQDADNIFKKFKNHAKTLPPVGRNVNSFLFRLVADLRSSGRIEEARDVLRSFLASHPNESTAIQKLASIEVTAGNLDTAEALLRQGIDSAPHVVKLRVDLAKICMRTGEISEALELAQQIIGKLPEQREAMGIAVRALLRLGRIDECLNLACKVNAIEPLQQQLIDRIVKRANKPRNPEALIALLRTTLERDPDNESANIKLFEHLAAWRSVNAPDIELPRGNDFERRIEIAIEGASCVKDMDRVDGAGQTVVRQDGRFQRMFDGTLVTEHGYYGEWMSRLIAKLQGHHEPQEEKVFFEVLKYLESGQHMLELGCYWGFYSAAYLRHFSGNAKATLVEPDIHNIVVALETLRANGLSADVRLGCIAPTHPTLKSQPLTTDVNITPAQFDVTQFINGLEDGQLAILHADIQGAETSLLKQLMDLLEKEKIKYLFVSTHGRDLHVQCLKALAASRYRLVAEHDDFESFSFDGLIVVRAPSTSGPPYIHLPVRKPGLTTAPVKERGTIRDDDGQKFLLIKQLGHGFWANVEHTVWQLVVAETLGRTPIIHWGPSGYYGDDSSETFELYFKPLSDVTIEDVRNFSLYPEYWNKENIGNQCPAGADGLDIAVRRSQFLAELTEQKNAQSQDVAPSDLGTGNLLDHQGQEDVLVSMTYRHINDLRKFLPSDSPYKNMTADEVRKTIFQKYFTLQNTIQELVGNQWRTLIPKNTKVAAVHCRATDKLIDEMVPQEYNAQIMREAEKWVERTDGQIFLMTESNIERKKFIERFGERVITQDCFRSSVERTPNFRHLDSDGYANGKSILIDTYVGARCDYFIGCSYSNVSNYVVAINNLQHDNIRLVDRMLLES